MKLKLMKQKKETIVKTKMDTHENIILEIAEKDIEEIMELNKESESVEPIIDKIPSRFVVKSIRQNREIISGALLFQNNW